MINIKVGLLQQFISFGKKASGGRVKNEMISDKELTEKLHKPIIKKLKKKKIISFYRSYLGVRSSRYAIDK